MGPTAFELQCGISSLAPKVGSGENLLSSRPRRGWLLSIYMRGGAPFQDMMVMNIISSNTIKTLKM